MNRDESSARLRNRIENMLKNKATSQEYRKRAQVILSILEGKTMRAISTETGVSRPTQIRWKEQYEAVGLEMFLSQAGILGRPPKKCPKHLPSTNTKKATYGSLKDVATDLSLSVSTVSRALRDDPLVAKATKKRVLQAVKEGGYEIHPYVRSLMKTIRRGIREDTKEGLAWISFEENYLCSNTKKKGTDTYYYYAHKRASELGFSMSYFSPIQECITPKRLEEILIARGIRGFLVEASSAAHRDYLQSLNTERFNIVSFSTIPGFRSLPTVLPNTELDMLRACYELSARGAKKIAYLYSASNVRSTFLMPLISYHGYSVQVAGHRNILPALDISQMHHHIIKGWRSKNWSFVRNLMPDWLAHKDWESILKAIEKDLSAQNIRQQVDSLMILLLKAYYEETCFDAIITQDGRIIRWLEQIGLKVPNDVSVVHLNIREDVKDWAGILRASETIGTNATELLIENITNLKKNSKLKTALHLYPGNWQEGHTIWPRLKRDNKQIHYELRWIEELLEVPVKNRLS